MASHSVAANEIGAHNKTLVAATVDTVTFADDLAAVEVFTDGSEDIYFTVDGSTPTVAGANCWFLPTAMSVRRVVVPASGGTVVKLISSATPTYSVSRSD